MLWMAVFTRPGGVPSKAKRHVQAEAAQMKSHRGFTCVTSEPHPPPLLSVDNGHRDPRGCWVVEVT